MTNQLKAQHTQDGGSNTAQPFRTKFNIVKHNLNGGWEYQIFEDFNTDEPRLMCTCSNAINATYICGLLNHKEHENKVKERNFDCFGSLK